MVPPPVIFPVMWAACSSVAFLPTTAAPSATVMLVAVASVMALSKYSGASEGVPASKCRR